MQIKMTTAKGHASPHEEDPTSFITQENNTVTIKILLQPRASKNEVKGIQDDRLKVRLKSPPVDGEANKELIGFMAKLLGVKKAEVEITSGLASRRKTLRIDGLSKEEAVKRLDIS